MTRPAQRTDVTQTGHRSRLLWPLTESLIFIISPYWWDIGHHTAYLQPLTPSLSESYRVWRMCKDCQNDKEFSGPCIYIQDIYKTVIISKLKKFLLTNVYHQRFVARQENTILAFWVHNLSLPCLHVHLNRQK